MVAIRLANKNELSARQFLTQQPALAGASIGLALIALAALVSLRINMAAPLLGLAGLSVTVGSVGALALAAIALSALIGQLVLPIAFKPSAPMDLLRAGLQTRIEGWVVEAITQNPTLINWQCIRNKAAKSWHPSYTPMEATLLLGFSLESIRHLFQRCRDQLTNKDSILLLAVEKGREDVVRYLLEEEALPLDGSFNNQDYMLSNRDDYQHLVRKGITPLARAIKHAQWDIAQYLVKKGAAIMLWNGTSLLDKAFRTYDEQKASIDRYLGNMLPLDRYTKSVKELMRVIQENRGTDETIRRGASRAF